MKETKKIWLSTALILVFTITFTACGGGGGGDNGGNSNTNPVANAGVDQNVATDSLVSLDGSGSSDADGNTLTYNWLFVSVAPSSVLTNADLTDAATVSPDFTPDKDGDYVLQLVVNDGTVDSTADTVTITATSEFPPGSLVIPMDVDYQDDEMLKAFGLVYQLLLNDIPVSWVIKSGKSFDEPDFVASGIDYETSTVITSHGYRGGPFVIYSTDAALAKPIIDAYQADHATAVAVHEITGSFTANVSRQLVSAPSIALFADGKQDIARDYLGAAGIPDSTGDYLWPDTSPDVLDISEVSGPTGTSHSDGALFDADGDPVYCNFISSHWTIADAESNPEVVAETREFLRNPVRFSAQSQSVRAFENSVYGHFLTDHGLMLDNLSAGAPVDLFFADRPLVQLDSSFGLKNGSDRSFSPCGDATCVTTGPYKSGNVVMITGQGTPEGSQDVWMSGYLDGACPPSDLSCQSGGNNLGKVSYLSGYSYDTVLPISSNPETVGTRLFLNSLLDTPCAEVGGQPTLEVTASVPAQTTSDTITVDVASVNTGPGVALDGVLSFTLPADTTYVSSTGGGSESGGTVTWSMGNLGVDESGNVSVTVTLGSLGQYSFTASLNYRAGLNDSRTSDSNITTTQYVLP